MITHDVAHLAHDAQLCRCQEVMQREADPCDIHRFGAVSQRLNEIAVVQPDWTGERLKSLVRQFQRRLANVSLLLEWARPRLNAASTSVVGPRPDLIAAPTFCYPFALRRSDTKDDGR